MINIHSIETFGTHEGPGLRFVIFVQGCNYRCLYCHNPDSQETGVAGKNYSVGGLVKMIEKNIPYFSQSGGVTISGGEPLLQAKEITGLFKRLRKNNIHTALDTNGSILNKEIKNLLKYTDLVLLDLKQIDPTWHEKITGAPFAEYIPALKFADYLEAQNIPFWIRYVLVPGYTDQSECLNQTAQCLSRYKYLERIEILPYHSMGEYKYGELGIEYKLKNVEPPTAEKIQKAKRILGKSGKKVVVR